MDQRKELQQILDFHRYRDLESCRATLRLRELELGYQDGRIVSVRKQMKQRELFIKENQENWEYNITTHPSEKSDPLTESEQEKRLRRMQLIYRLLMSMDPKIGELARRVKATLKELGVEVAVPQHSKGSLQSNVLCDRVWQSLISEIHSMYQRNIILEDGYSQFERMTSHFLEEQLPTKYQERKRDLKRQDSRQSSSISANEFLNVKIRHETGLYNKLAALMAEVDSQHQKIMKCPIKNEDDPNEPIIEWMHFDDQMSEEYKDPLENIPMVLPTYNPDVKIPDDTQAEEQQQQVVIHQSRENKNYMKDFFDKHGLTLMEVSRDYWQLLMFDLLKELCDLKNSISDLEIKLYSMLKNVEAVKYLLTFRKEIVAYLHKTKFWEQKPGGPQIQTTSATNHQVLAVIGMDPDEIEEAAKLGLKKRDLQGNERKKQQKQTQDEGLAIHDPSEYQKMDEKRLLQFFPTSTREERPEYLKIRIDPLPKKPVEVKDLIKVETLPEWSRKAFEGTETLNVIQSVIYERAFQTEDNILVCAPTGAGKTNIALLTILQELNKRVDHKLKTLRDHDFKIVYISPMKALASEIVEKFQNRLKYLGVKVKEFTGDMQLSKKELQETHIILTTPEKWDVVTRKTNAVSDQLQLLIIDEIHLLNDERGPILECVVARTVKQLERAQRFIRLVGLSATLPNYWDVAVFLQVKKEGVFYFDQTYRPVPLCQKFVGVKDPVQRNKGPKRRKQDVQNEITYEGLIDVLRHNKQVMVFVHSRKETVNFCKYIQIKAKNESHQFLFMTHKKEFKQNINDKELKQLIPYGVGYHHAGMLRADRNLVERLFFEGDIKVLVATATLAWGVNLPAFAVIIKGTDIFDASRADMQNLSVLDVQQMFGRAGRPQFDDKGEATLITDFNNVGHYMAMLNNASFIESRLMGFIKEALNAEIVLGNISNYPEAYDWLNQTFFSIRLKRNPRNYGVVNNFGPELDCDFLVEQKITEALANLDELRLVRFDKRNQTVVATELGRIASHYYIRCETMKILCDQMGIHFDSNVQNRDMSQLKKYQYRSQFELLKIMAKAKEFEMLRVRPEEQIELKRIFQDYWIFEEKPKLGVLDNDELETEDIVIEIEEKVMALLSGYICQMQYDAYSLVMDTHLVVQNSIRLARCMLEMAMKKNQAQMTHKLLRLCKLIENRMSEDRTPLAQFSKEIFQGYNSRKQTKSRDGFISNQILDIVDQCRLSLGELSEMHEDEMAHVLNSSKHFCRIIKNYIYYLPRVDVDCSIKPIAQSILKVVLNVSPDWQSSSRWHMRQEPFWVFVDNEEELLHYEEFLISERMVNEGGTMEISFFVPYQGRKGEKYYLTVTSDRWLEREEYYQVLDLDDIVIENDLVEFTQLLDLNPLPTRCLGKQEYENLFPFKFFNPIQTQVFHALFHSDDNILIGAPTGSGKTIMAEFAMFRVFVQQPQKKVIYIAPMKAIAKERLKDWDKRLSALGKSVLELTGDYTPDQEALQNADVLITTPEKWDGISRSWANRSYVSSTALLIFDEIHLLGQDRGPVLEVIVSRMNLISSKTGSKARLVGLSTAMANGTDVGDWFGVKKHRFYNFKPSVRPVPVTIHFNGFAERAYCPRMGTMNKPAFYDIKRHSEGKPVIIFVSSRRQTRLTAMDLIALQVHETGTGISPYLKCQQYEIELYQERAQDEFLKQSLGFGIGMHHAGLTSEDRGIVEELFVNGKIQVLVATSTLAWGVNFPARLVIVKGTEYYDPKQKKYVDMPVTDILQMIGRAGRPQFDTQATACVYVEQSKKNFYHKYLNNPFPIESSLLSQLPDHINAEVASGSISNMQQCVDWLTWTYFFRRLLKNPSFYGLASNQTSIIKEYLLKLVQDTIQTLQRSGCVKVSDGVIEPTFLGNLASFYYIRHQTVFHYNERIAERNSIEDLMRTLSYSSEFQEVPMRHNEDNMNEALSKICPLKAQTQFIHLAQEKTFLLLQAHMFSLPVPIRDFITDTKLVIDSSIRMIHAMVDLAAEKGYLQTTLNIILLLQMIIQGVWFNQSSLINVPHFDQNIIKELRKIGINHLCELAHSFHLEKDRIKRLLRDPSCIEQVEQAINQVPIVDVKFKLQGMDPETLKPNPDVAVPSKGEVFVCVDLYRQNKQYSQRVLIQKLAKIKDAGWWLCVGSEEKLLAIKKIYFKNVAKKQLLIQMPDSGKIQIYLLSDSYLGLDQIIRVQQ